MGRLRDIPAGKNKMVISSKTLAIAWAASEINQLEGVLEAHLYRIDIRQTVVDMEIYEEENEIEVWHKYYPHTEKRLMHLFPPIDAGRRGVPEFQSPPVPAA